MPLTTRRKIVDPTHPAAMMPEQRRTERATIFADRVNRRVEWRRCNESDESDTRTGQESRSDRLALDGHCERR